MKHLFFLLLALVLSGAASAQRLMVGVRGGVSFADYSFVPTRIGDTRFSPGSVRAGYNVGFVLRLNLSKHLHLQSELDYAFVNYNVLAENSGSRRITLRTERFEIPVQLGFQFGVLRLFGGERINGLMETLGIDEDTPIENKMLTRSIEGAQRRVEERNFGIRRNVLQYDDVMNRQREIIYSQRDQVLDGESVKDSILKMLVDSFHANAKTYTADEDHTQWNLEGLRDYFRGWIGTDDDFQYTAQELEDMTPEEIVQPLIDRALKVYEEKEELYGSEIMRELERVILLKTVDRYWMDHIDNMDELRKGIHLRAYGQKDPVVLYRIEGFDMFDGMIAAIQEDTVRLMLTVQIRQAEEPKREQVAKETGTSADGTDAPRTVRKRASEKVGRNDPCPCGSGKKYKKCCGRTAGDSEE